MMRIVILGSTGQLGRALQARAAALGTVTPLARTDLDLTDHAALTRTLMDLRPDVVCNAAAYTAVDQAERTPTPAWAINAHAPAVMAQACAELGALLVHYSTDYVFDGRQSTPYQETDTPAPLNVYGASKLAGEQAVLGSAAAAIVLRTSWVYGDEGQNFAKTMLRLACERDQLRVVADQHGAPTWAGRLADLTCHIIQSTATAGHDREARMARRGLYHACAAGHTTWADYARLVLATAAEHPDWAARLKVKAADIEGIPASAYPTPATRPHNSRLDCRRLEAVWGYRMPAWEEDVRGFVRRAVGGQGA